MLAEATTIPSVTTRPRTPPPMPAVQTVTSSPRSPPPLRERRATSLQRTEGILTSPVWTDSYAPHRFFLFHKSLNCDLGLTLGVLRKCVFSCLKKLFIFYLVWMQMLNLTLSANILCTFFFLPQIWFWQIDSTPAFIFTSLKHRSGLIHNHIIFTITP